MNPLRLMLETRKSGKKWSQYWYAKFGKNMSNGYMDADTYIDDQNEIVAETAEAPPSLIMPLLRY